MNQDELNPDHPVTRGYSDQWHKLLALAMHVLRVEAVDITAATIRAFEARGPMAVVVHDGVNPPGAPARLQLRLVSMEEAEQLARTAGGRPS